MSFISRKLRITLKCKLEPPNTKVINLISVADQIK